MVWFGRYGLVWFGFVNKASLELHLGTIPAQSGPGWVGPVK